MRKCWIMVGMAALVVGCGRGTSTAAYIETLRSEDSSVRLHAAKALGDKRTDSHLVVPALAEALSDNDAFVRREAATSLGRIGSNAKAAIPALLAATHDRQPKVRAAASEALKKIDAEAVSVTRVN